MSVSADTNTFQSSNPAAWASDTHNFFKKTLEDLNKFEYRMMASAVREPFPANIGDTIVFTDVTFPSMPEEATEGVTPTPDTWSLATVTATLKQYAQVMELTDWMRMVRIHGDQAVGVVNQFLVGLAARKIDQLLQEAAGAATTALYGGGVASRDVLTATSYVDSALVREMKRTLRVGTQNVEGSAPYFSNGCYRFIAHENMIQALYRDTDLRNLMYNGNAPLNAADGAVGKYHNIEFVPTAYGPELTNIGDPEGTSVLGASTITAATSGGSLADDDYYVMVVIQDDRRGFDEDISAESVAKTISGGSGNGSITVDVSALAANAKATLYAGTTSGALTIAEDASGAELTGLTSASGTVTIGELGTTAAPVIPPSGVTVYRGYLLAANTLAWSGLKSLELFRNTGADKFDPANQIDSFASKFDFTSVLKRQERALVVEAPGD